MNKVSKSLLSATHLRLLCQSLIEAYVNYDSIIWPNLEEVPCVLKCYINFKSSYHGLKHVTYRDRSQPSLVGFTPADIVILCINHLIIYYLVNIIMSHL